ncbi:MAG: ABC transporter permease [Anaerolineae bacterium]|jgi:ABC-2 type transport system permease protein|nr:ABC transporter permease [Anaerolineae bacterium]
MAAVAQSKPTVQPSARAERSMSFINQTAMLAKRTLITNFRDPAAVIPPLLISVFFLLVNSSTLSGAASFFLPGQSYLGFIVPLTIISSSLSGAGIAGQSIVRDIERGYFDKLMLTPVSRAAIVLGPMIAGALLLTLQTALIILIALLMGLQPETGIVGLVSTLVFATFIGISFAGFTVGMALFTGSAAATGGASFIFFPLTFLTATYVPFDLLTGWIKVAAEFNPITYPLEAMRALLNTGWDGDLMLKGVGSCLLLGSVLFAFAIFGLRTRTQRR